MYRTADISFQGFPTAASKLPDDAVGQAAPVASGSIAAIHRTPDVAVSRSGIQGFGATRKKAVRSVVMVRTGEEAFFAYDIAAMSYDIRSMSYVKGLMLYDIKSMSYVKDSMS